MADIPSRIGRSLPGLSCFRLAFRDGGVCAAVCGERGNARPARVHNACRHFNRQPPSATSCRSTASVSGRRRCAWRLTTPAAWSARPTRAQRACPGAPIHRSTSGIRRARLCVEHAVHCGRPQRLQSSQRTIRPLPQPRGGVSRCASTGQITAIACPSSGLCVMIDGDGNVACVDESEAPHYRSVEQAQPDE